MSARQLSLQDHFLNSVRRAKVPLTIFLVKGVKLQGVVTWFDAFSLLLRREGTSQLVYKHSISTIMPSRVPPDFVASRDARRAGAKAPMQDLFLAAAARDRERMTLFLVNGVMLQGSVTAFDQFSLLLERGGQIQLVYKHAISTLQPDHALKLEREPAVTKIRRKRRLNNFDGNGAIEVARGERALIVVPELPGEASRRSADARIEEAEGLAEAIGVVVAAERVFRLRAVRPATLLGKGQVEEVAALAKEHGAGLLIVDAALTPGPAEEPRGRGRAPR